MKKQNQQPAVPSNSFAHLLNTVDKGLFSGECSEKLNELVTSIKGAGKAGEITVKIKLAPDSGTTRFRFTTECRIKAP